MSFPILWSFAAGLAAALILVPLARRASSKVGMVSQPVPDRWHQRSVGKLGGVAMAAALDLGVALAMRPVPESVRLVLAAHMAKADGPMRGRDLHIGDFGWGVLPAAAPLGIPTLTVAGLALAFAREDSGRLAVSFIGEGGSSLGEWHEAINLCAARRAARRVLRREQPGGAVDARARAVAQDPLPPSARASAGAPRP